MPPPTPRSVRRAAAALLCVVPLAAAASTDPGWPQQLADTGLPLTGEPPSDIASFTPQYPLWSDGTAKRRWIRLPAAAIDASDPDAWQFPSGTRLWKEFALGGRKLETRVIERRADGRWHFAAYVWDAAGGGATLAPAEGMTIAVDAAPNGRYVVPSRKDCLACHGSTRVPVLGFSALQLSPDRDPLAAPRPQRGDVDLRSLVERGQLQGLPAAQLDAPPHIAAGSALERAALGYLHGNCAHCHNRSQWRAPVRLTLEQSATDPAASRATVLRSLVDARSRWRAPDSQDDARIVAPGRPDHSVLVVRMRARDARTQMPPLGTDRPDPEGLALVQRWIEHHHPTSMENAP